MPVDTNAVAAEIAVEIADYRQGEIETPTREHVLRWVQQFDAPMRPDILVETRHFLDRLYASKKAVGKFITGLSSHADLVGSDPSTFWAGVGFLRLQERSQSQRDMLALLSDVLEDAYGVTCVRQTATNGAYIYIDDAIFSGGQVLHDLRRWIEDENISGCTIHVICIGWHKSGQWYAERELKKVAGPRKINIGWWRSVEIEDWRKPGNEGTVDVLWPTRPAKDQYVDHWLADCPNDDKWFNPRQQAQGVQNTNFNSEAGRTVLEQAFLQRGAYIRSLPRNPDGNMHPLGYHKLGGPGCGTLLTTYRNCPNNAPLVLWWGDQHAGHPLNQWYPLLPRRTRAAG